MEKICDFNLTRPKIWIKEKNGENRLQTIFNQIFPITLGLITYNENHHLYIYLSFFDTTFWTCYIVYHLFNLEAHSHIGSGLTKDRSSCGPTRTGLDPLILIY